MTNEQAQFLADIMRERDALKARVAEVEKERDEWRHAWEKRGSAADYVWRRKQAAESSLAASRRQVEGLNRILTHYEQMGVNKALDAPAQEEAEMPADFLARLGDDAAKWAAEFRKIAIKLGYSDMDEGWLIGWFANAIEHSSSIRAALDAPQPEARDNDTMRIQVGPSCCPNCGWPLDSARHAELCGYVVTTNEALAANPLPEEIEVTPEMISAGNEAATLAASIHRSTFFTAIYRAMRAKEPKR